MKKFIILAFGAFMLFGLNSCVESSKKYKALQAQLDTLAISYQERSVELESMFSELNEIVAGMQSIREAENILEVESSDRNGDGNKSKKQITILKDDVKAITDAIAGYKEQIAQLQKKNKNQSAEFKKLVTGLNEELDKRGERIAEITQQLAEKEKQLGIKNQEIVKLNENVASLNQESTSQKETISQQDQTIFLAHYLLGSRKELKQAKVVSRQGLFCPPIVSSQAQNADFTSIDLRQVKLIPLQTKKAKILSAHPADSYELETGDDGMLTLKIKNENAFWKQTRYLVVMISE